MAKPNKILVQFDKKNQNWRVEKPNSKRACSIVNIEKEALKKATTIAKNQGLELIAFSKKRHQINIKNSF
jgi:hypothetical protein